ncbi:hypothetical protein [Aliarcobacter faecis]|uniref:hypothetical protein n=1 Tax=Aliarcobacter faecis TaxID=1564138 RepID=UPI0017872F38|nr:hypothetical protein [Aliarcobacter faecis]
MDNTELQQSILQNLLLGLQKQSKYFLDRLESSDLTPSEAKDIDKEISDINNVLNQLSNKTINYTVAELEALKVTFNQKLEQLNSVLTNLEINTLKIEFDTLTPEQKEFLKVKGDKGDKGDGAYELAKRYGFEGNEIDFLNSLKGKDGNFEDLTQSKKDSLKGKDGLSAYELALKNGFSGTEQQYLDSLKGENGNFEDLTQSQKDSLKGQDGLSAYELALKNGFSGTEQEYLDSLKGQNGNFEDLTQSQKDSLKGQNGLSAYELALKNGFSGTEHEYLASLIGKNGNDLDFLGYLVNNGIYTGFDGFVELIQNNIKNSGVFVLASSQGGEDNGENNNGENNQGGEDNSGENTNIEYKFEYLKNKNLLYQDGALLKNRFYFVFGLSVNIGDVISILYYNAQGLKGSLVLTVASDYYNGLVFKYDNGTPPENIEVEYATVIKNDDLVVAFYLDFKDKTTQNRVYPFETFQVSIMKDNKYITVPNTVVSKDETHLNLFKKDIVVN